MRSKYAVATGKVEMHEPSNRVRGVVRHFGRCTPAAQPVAFVHSGSPLLYKREHQGLSVTGRLLEVQVM
jgi:hypothetical protein